MSAAYRLANASHAVSHSVQHHNYCYEHPFDHPCDATVDSLRATLGLIVVLFCVMMCLLILCYNDYHTPRGNAPAVVAKTNGAPNDGEVLSWEVLDRDKICIKVERVPSTQR
jgi:hypothetical protein